MMKFDNLLTFTRHKTLVIVIVFFIALIPRLYNIGGKSAWMDESKQAALSTVSPFDFNLAERASRQQQPPLDYFIQAIMIKNFGLNEVGIRIHAAIFGALSALLLFLLLLRIVDNHLAVLAGTLAFVFHPYMIRYSQEGRPISTAVFFSLLYLYFLIKHFHTAYPQKHSIRSFIILAAVQVGFLLSVGLQPIIFLLVSSICLVPFIAIREKRRLVFPAYLSSALAFLISLPIFKMAISTGARYGFIKYDSILSMIKNLVQGISHISVDILIQYYRTSLGGFSLFLLVVIAAGIIGFILSSKKRDYTFTLLYFVLFFLIYPLVYTIVFKSLVSWKLEPRYYLTFAPVCLAFMTTAVCFSLQLPAKAASFSRPLMYVSVFVLVSIYAYSFIPDMQSLSRFYTSKKTEWNKMYDVFKYHSQPGDIAYMLNLVKIDNYSPDFRAKNLYYPAAQPRPVELKHARNIPRDLKNPEILKQGKNIYIVTRYGSEKIKETFFTKRGRRPQPHARHGHFPTLKTFSQIFVFFASFYRILVKSENIEVLLFYNISVVRIKKSQRTREQFVEALRRLTSKLPQHESNYLLYEILIAIDLDNGNIEEASKNIERLEAMNKRKKLDKLIRRFKRRLNRVKMRITGPLTITGLNPSAG